MIVGDRAANVLGKGPQDWWPQGRDSVMLSEERREELHRDLERLHREAQGKRKVAMILCAIGAGMYLAAPVSSGAVVVSLVLFFGAGIYLLATG